MFSTGSGLKIGRIGSHELFIDPIPFAILGFFVFSGSDGDYRWPVSFLVAAVFSILIHELGHAMAIKRLTGQSTAIVLGFGGATISYGTRNARHQFLISLAGPAAGALLGVAAWLVALSVVQLGSWIPWEFETGESIWLMALSQIIWISVIWTVFNLMPAVPFDGGQALRALLIMMGVKVFSARRYTRMTSIVCAVLMVVAWRQGYGSFLLAFFALMIVLRVMDEARAEGF